MKRLEKWNQLLTNLTNSHPNFGKMTKKDWHKQRAFGKALTNIEIALYPTSRGTIAEQIEAIDYMMRLIRIDLASSRKLDAIYGLVWDDELFPDVFDWKGRHIKGMEPLEEERDYPLNEETYISTWKPRSLVKAFKTIKNRCFKANDNHRARYYKELDLLHVYNGKHSATAGTVLGGSVPAQLVSISHLYDKIETDGVYWYCPDSFKSDKRMWKTSDFRVALLYELSKMKYELVNSN